MHGFLKGAMFAAAITSSAQAQDVAVLDLPLSPEAHVLFFDMGVSAGDRSAIFVLEHGGEVQPMYKAPEGIYSGTFYSHIAVSCKELTQDFEKSVDFIDQELRPTTIQIDRDAIRASIVTAAQEARYKCLPGFVA